jgi:hypothetical protein
VQFYSHAGAEQSVAPLIGAPAVQQTSSKSLAWILTTKPGNT